MVKLYAGKIQRHKAVAEPIVSQNQKHMIQGKAKGAMKPKNKLLPMSGAETAKKER